MATGFGIAVMERSAAERAYATLRAAVVGGYPAGGLFLSWSIVVQLVRVLLVGVIVMCGGLIFGGGIGFLRKELSPRCIALGLALHD